MYRWEREGGFLGGGTKGNNTGVNTSVKDPGCFFFEEGALHPICVKRGGDLGKLITVRGGEERYY